MYDLNHVLGKGTLVNVVEVIKENSEERTRKMKRWRALVLIFTLNVIGVLSWTKYIAILQEICEYLCEDIIEEFIQCYSWAFAGCSHLWRLESITRALERMVSRTISRALN